MTQSRRGLGRGLDALFGNAAVAEPPPAAAPAPTLVPAPEPPPVATVVTATVTPIRRGGPEQVDIDLIAPNPEQPRTNFEPEKLRELADSIREHGIIQPLIVSRDDSGSYRLIAGERRLQAARLAGFPTVPVIFREAADAELLELALIENIQRADLNPIEEAAAYRRLIDDHGLTQEDAARRVGKSRAAVANAMRLLALEPDIRRSLVAGELSEGHARALLGIAESRTRLNAWRDVIRKRLSVRDTEALVRRLTAENDSLPARGPVTTARRDAAFSEIEGQLRRALSTRVSVTPARGGARILIECFSPEEFEGVVHQILGTAEEDL